MVLNGNGAMAEKNNTKKKRILIGLGVLLLIAAGVLAWRLWFAPSGDGPAGNIDPNAAAWDDQLSAPTAAQGSIQIPGYTAAAMHAGDDSLALRIGNPAENTCYLQATLKLEDGTVLFTSGLLEPGTGFETVPLSQQLSPGTYSAYVHYQGYSLDDKKTPLNSADSAFVLTVQE
jgi:hypothetical protein